MPRIIQNAWGIADKFTADVRTHAVTINPTQIEQFDPEGTLVSAQLGLNYVCRHCHGAGLGPDLTDDELIQAAIVYHQTASIPPPEATIETP